MISFNNIIEIYKIAKEWFPLPIIAIILGIVGTTILIKNRKKVYGFAIITGWYLHFLAVSSKHHGKGHGKSLLEKALPHIDKLRVGIHNKRAITLYESYGFKIIDKHNSITGMKYLMTRTHIN